MVIMAGTKNINKTDSSPDSSFILESVWINLVKKGTAKHHTMKRAPSNYVIIHSNLCQDAFNTLNQLEK